MSESNKGKHNTTEEYILSQTSERQLVLKKLKKVISQNLPKCFEESMQYNMITFVIPLKTYPKGYLDNPLQPIPFISIASQKNYIAIYHMGVVASKSLKDYFVDSYSALNIGKLDMGKSCIRFKNINKIPYQLIGELCTKMTANEYIELYDKYRNK